MTALREGFTTGSCAAACALASCLWQRDGACPAQVALTVPEGRAYMAEIHAMGPYRCAVYKDSGDDPDITNGSEVWAEVQLLPKGPIQFRAGEGVGTVTLPGLKVPVGEAAINPVPRRMIAEAVRSVFPERGAVVTVGVTGGRELAQKTFNPRLGIVGGLSILGTTGIVRPMSEEALTDTIRLELSLRKTNGADSIALVFGSQGEEALT
ncbi:MAG: cobalt-precorrin-5B (C(1))-methyltransferase, partial [Clostridia bacterium]|nr:cobalt-precorrin-5B (C(1))-methyltransferase [Clostridia bacterium]